MSVGCLLWHVYAGYLLLCTAGCALRAALRPGSQCGPVWKSSFIQREGRRRGVATSCLIYRLWLRICKQQGKGRHVGMHFCAYFWLSLDLCWYVVLATLVAKRQGLPEALVVNFVCAGQYNTRGTGHLLKTTHTQPLCSSAIVTTAPYEVVEDGWMDGWNCDFIEKF